MKVFRAYPPIVSEHSELSLLIEFEMSPPKKDSDTDRSPESKNRKLVEEITEPMNNLKRELFKDDEAYQTYLQSFGELKGSIKILVFDKVEASVEVGNLREKMGKLKIEKHIITNAQKLHRCVLIIRQKIERLETRFSITCDLPVTEMHSQIYAYLRKYKNETTEAISDKLDGLVKEEKTKMLNFFNQDNIKNLSNEIFAKWKEGVKSKIDTCPHLDLHEEQKQKISELIMETNVHLDHLKIIDQYPVHFNARFTKWMYFLIFSIDKLAKQINQAIVDDPDMDLFSFCVSVVKIYATSSKLFHPAPKIMYTDTLKFKDIMDILEKDLEIDDHDILKSAEILLKAGVKKECLSNVM